MMVRIFTDLAEKIRAHAAADHPREACGLLLGRTGLIEEIRAAANVSTDGCARFELDPVALLRAQREARDGGRALLGWYHSHPNGRGEPSAADVEGASEAGKLWLIVATGRLRAFVWTGESFIEVALVEIAGDAGHAHLPVQPSRTAP
jgi:desampylase